MPRAVLFCLRGALLTTPDQPSTTGYLELDLSGLKCPLPVLRTRKALNGLAPGAGLVVTCTDPLSAIDIPHLVRQQGDELEGHENRDGVLRFVIRRGGEV